MKIADGLELLKSMGREKTRLSSLAEREAWSYRSTDPDAKWVPNFDLDKINKEVRELDRKMRKLSRAINATNNSQEVLGVADSDYSDWL